MKNYKKFNFKRNFGVELEAHPVLDASAITSVIRKNSSRKVITTGWQQTSNNSYWHLKTDSTCGGGEKRGWEIASFKGSGNKDIVRIAKVAESLKDAGLKCGSDCGFHVHVDISDFSPNQVGILLAWWIKIEKIVLNSVPQHRFNNKHCRLISSKINPKNKKYNALNFWETYKPKNFSFHGNRDKKVTMNLVNYATSLYYKENKRKNRFFDLSRKTVEFRFPEGTFSGNDVKNWIRFFILFVENVKDKKMPKDLLTIKSFEEFMFVVGFYKDKQTYFCLSPILENLKIWFFERVVSNSKSIKWKRIFEKNLSK